MNVAFIPVRGGSKSIPLKNIREVFGKPLVYWTVRAACGCRSIDRIYVATDNDQIRETVEEFVKNEINEGNGAGSEIDFSKVQVIGRSKESAEDTASTEFAMLEFAGGYDFDNIVLIQATSPLLTAKDLDKGFDAFAEENVDSVFSVVREKKFCWEIDKDGFARAQNYDPYNRPRRQEFDGVLIENGAFYITSKELLVSSGNRFSGNIRAVEMPEDAFIDIDEPTDLLLVEKIMRKRQQESGNESGSSAGIPAIKMFLTDCDGCLTDAGMYYSPEGDLLKKYNTKDGMGIRLLRERGILTGIVTGESVDINKRRVEKLKMDIYEPGCRDKRSTVERLCKEHGISPENVVFVGDDINDLDAMKYVGYPCTVSDGHKSVKEVAKYISKEPGGHGAIRDIVDHILGL